MNTTQHATADKMWSSLWKETRKEEKTKMTQRTAKTTLENIMITASQLKAIEDELINNAMSVDIDVINKRLDYLQYVALRDKLKLSTMVANKRL
jgi:hypothetical protein